MIIFLPKIYRKLNNTIKYVTSDREKSKEIFNELSDLKNQVIKSFSCSVYVCNQIKNQSWDPKKLRTIYSNYVCSIHMNM